ncbi:MAG: FkbM family methyltransferase, partial [Ginsengibacter sp.]
MKKIIKYIFGLLNINVTKIPGRSKAIADIEEKEINIAKQKFQWLSKYSINKIVDIGANEGQFASGIYKVFPTAGFFCFEPIPGVFNLLKENLEKYNNFCFFQLALGDAKGKNIIHLNDFSPSSSILEMDKL